MTGASLNRGASRQDYRTPPEFLSAVKARFGRLAWDLAADAESSVSALDNYYGPDSPHGEDALALDWDQDANLPVAGTLWCNPPFANLAPWAEHCASLRDRAGWTLLLVPASVGTEWWARHVHGVGYALWLAPRLKFVGCADPYPKDLALVAYGFGVTGAAPWRWKT